MLASEDKIVATGSYKKLMSKVSGLYKILTVRDDTQAIVEDGIENTIRIYIAAEASRLQKDHGTNGYGRRTEGEPPLIKLNETSNEDNKRFVVDKTVRCITGNGNIKYTVGSYGYPPGDEIVEDAHYLPQKFLTQYWQRVKLQNRRRRSRKSHACILQNQ